MGTSNERASIPARLQPMALLAESAAPANDLRSRRESPPRRPRSDDGLERQAVAEMPIGALDFSVSSAAGRSGSLKGANSKASSDAKSARKSAALSV